MSSAKFVVLQKLRAERDILFSETGPATGVTKAMKIKKWTEIAELAQSMGLMQGKPWQYMRDTIWPNWRKRTMAKNPTGGPGASEHDELVFEIMTKPEPPGDAGAVSMHTHNIDNFLSDSTFNDTVYATPLERKRKRQAYPSDEPENKKKIRIDLQIENLKIKSYKMKLEALEIETRLGLPRSCYTRGLPYPGAAANLPRPSTSPPSPANNDETYKTEM